MTARDDGALKWRCRLVDSRRKYAVTVPEAAELLSLSERTVRDLLRDDPGFPRVYVGRRVIVPLRALEEWANAKAADESRRERKSVRFLAADSS